MPFEIQFHQKLQDPMTAISVYHDLCDLIQLTNSTFTFPLIFVILNYFIMNLFATFGFVWMFMRDFQYFFFSLSSDGPWIAYNLMLQGILIHSSCKTTEEAEKVSVIVSKVINSTDCSKAQRKVFKNFLIQNQCRDLKLQTAFFVINWKLLLAVSKASFKKSSNSII